MAEDYLTGMQDSLSKWAQSQKDGIFKESKKPYNPAPTKISDYMIEGFNPADYGMSAGMAKLASNSENMTDTEYWAAVTRLSLEPDDDSSDEPERHRSNAPEGILHEAGSIDTPNPVSASTIGSDTAVHVTPWGLGDVFQKLQKMKLELHELGNKLAGSGMKSWVAKPVESTVKPNADVMKQIHSLQSQIDKISDSLAPGTIEKDSKS